MNPPTSQVACLAQGGFISLGLHDQRLVGNRVGRVAHQGNQVIKCGWGELDESLACYRRALELKPAYAKAHANLGNALKDQGKLDEAVACYRRALELKPDHVLAYNNLGMAAFYLPLGLLIGFKSLLLVEVPVVVLSASAGVWLFYMQHQFEGVYWARTAEWDYLKAGLEGSSYYRLPALLNWITGNIGFHHIHHLSPRIPNYHLEKCHNANPLFQQVTPVTLFSSFKSFTFRLWDEQQRKLVGYRRLRDLRKFQQQTSDPL